MCLFPSSNTPSSPTPPPPIVDTTDTSNAAFTDAASTAKKKAALATGQSSTVLTGPLAPGQKNDATTQQPSLLGGS